MAQIWSTIGSTYWHMVRAPRYSLTFAFPLLAAYETLAFFLSQFEVVGVRNGADVLLKSLFVGMGGRDGLAIFGALLVGGGAAVVWRDVRRGGRIRPRYFAVMALESIGYALVFGLVAGTLTTWLLPRLTFSVAGIAGGQLADLNLAQQLMISLGAGIYEELLFRVLLVTGLVLIGTAAFGWRRARANLFAVIIGAIIFAAFHYVGPYGEPWALGSFTFRTVAGVMFSGLYVLRGFGITAWTHALYDVLLAVGW